ncbi:MAG: 1-aminocyclopropane-carboxylate deaminase [Pedobacter sp.]|jgi:1-aminocyclopropane-1-carboxylate deaminase|nr:1-aminocyclopropane-carboxylate deaminase [Pedobacter sp.]
MIDPYISGNKWRKLKYIIEAAKEKGKTHLVTFGGAYSNHLVATASAAARLGFKATAFVRGEPVDNETLLLCRLFDMKLIFTERELYKNKWVLFDAHFGDDPAAYFIDEGGASMEAVRGCAELIAELPKDFDYIFCAAGTGTTAAGLLQGVKQNGLSSQIHVVPVLKGGAFIKDEIAQFTEITEQLVLHTDYHFGGYAKSTEQLLAYMASFISAQGILIDPVYTAKLFFAIEDLAERNLIRKDAKILAIHTGGLLGIWGMQAKLNAILST